MRLPSARPLARLSRFPGGVLLSVLAAILLTLLPSGRALAQAADAGVAAAQPSAARASPASAPDAASPDAASPDAASPDAASTSAAAGGTGGSGDAFDPALTAPPTVRIPASEAEKAEGLPIAKIEVSGNRRVALDDVGTYLREKPGQLFRVENLSGDVRALWDAGFFDDIEADLERKDQGIVLRFLVRERPNIKAIEFSGNDELDNDKLNEIIEVKPNTILSVPAVRRSVNKIKDGYSEKGYFLAD